MKKIITVALLLHALSSPGQDGINIVPRPAEIGIKKGAPRFTLSAATKIFLVNEKNESKKLADFLNNYLFTTYGFKLKIAANFSEAKKAGYIEIGFRLIDRKSPFTYFLGASANSVSIYSNKAEGLFYGLQTLLQLVENANGVIQMRNDKLSIPPVTIIDYPRFQYRGMHLDVARHFFPVSYVKKYIDYLAAFKFNTFHWHLTDDQGWRIEIKKYPLLTQKGAWRNGTIIGRYPGKGNDNTVHGGFYTQEEIKEIVQYAADRYITVIPEIEMPGHASAAIAAYPQLSCFPDEDTKIPADCTWSGTTKGKQVQQTWGVFEDVFAPTGYTFNFLQDVLDEVTGLFPSKYIHIGGDECPKEAWKRSAFCQQLIKDQNLKDEHGLQSYFISRIEKYLNSKGRSIIGWDEILEGGLAPNATVMSWRGEEGGIEAAKQNHDVIMTPGSHCYIDHSQSKHEDSVTIGGYLPLEKVYSYEPVPAVLTEEQSAHILGAQANLWTEYVGYPSKVEYMIFPRMMALSEVLWSPKEKRDWNDFERRLPVLFKKLDQQGIKYSKAYYDLKATVIPAENNEGVLWKLESKNPNDKIVYLTGLEDSRYFEYKKPLRPVLSGLEYMAWVEGKGNPITQKFFLNKATGKKITIVNPPSKSYPGDGAFTLVNAVQNEKGLARSNEFLGFSGTDLDVTIDLGAETAFKKVVLHSYGQTGSWIYQPAKLEVFFLNNTGENIAAAVKATANLQQQNGNLTTTVTGDYKCRFVRVVAKNFGTIPVGNPGAGSPAWLFVDEIEVE